MNNSYVCVPNNVASAIARKIQQDKKRLTNLSREQAVEFIKNVKKNGQTSTAVNGEMVSAFIRHKMDFD